MRHEQTHSVKVLTGTYHYFRQYPKGLLSELCLSILWLSQDHHLVYWWGAQFLATHFGKTLIVLSFALLHQRFWILSSNKHRPVRWISSCFPTCSAPKCVPYSVHTDNSLALPLLPLFVRTSWRLCAKFQNQYHFVSVRVSMWLTANASLGNTETTTEVNDNDRNWKVDRANQLSILNWPQNKSQYFRTAGAGQDHPKREHAQDTLQLCGFTKSLMGKRHTQNTAKWVNYNSSNSHTDNSKHLLSSS